MNGTVARRTRQIFAAVDLALVVSGRSFDSEARERAFNVLIGEEAKYWLLDYLDALPEASFPLDSAPVPLIPGNPQLN
jgi:hypothetical protein